VQIRESCGNYLVVNNRWSGLPIRIAPFGIRPVISEQRDVGGVIEE
jgi:hypothetical protein